MPDMDKPEGVEPELLPGQISLKGLNYLLGLIVETKLALDLSESGSIVVFGDWYGDPTGEGQLVLSASPTLEREVEAAVRAASREFMKAAEEQIRKIVPDLPPVNESAPFAFISGKLNLSAIRKDVRNK